MEETHDVPLETPDHKKAKKNPSWNKKRLHVPIKEKKILLSLI